MVKCCSEFADCKDEAKFEMCDSLRTIISSFPKAAFDDEPWLPMLQKGLQVTKKLFKYQCEALKYVSFQDILFSKINKQWRDPALKLVAAVIEVSDSDWCLDTNESPESSSNNGSGKFFMIMLNLACIEVIMHLEEKKLEESVKNSELLVACFQVF